MVPGRIRFDQQKQDWEELGKIDPYWAILSEPKYRNGKWNINEFLLTGETQVLQIMEWTKQHRFPKKFDTALDFGCGVGRLTRALAKHFRHVHAVDISATMLTRAKEINANNTNCSFEVYYDGLLENSKPNYYDFVCCLLVLQHLGDEQVVREYVGEFCRLLKPEGLLIFQLPHHIPFPYTFQVQRRVFQFLKLFGFRDRFIHKLGFSRIVNSYVPDSEIDKWLISFGARILETTACKSRVIDDRTYYVTK